MAVKKAARVYCVPETTLRERVNGTVDIACLASGPSPMFSQEQEARLVQHVSFLAKVGYGYTRGELCTLATEYAADIGLRPRENVLSFQWYRNFIKRWPTLAVKKNTVFINCSCKGNIIGESEHLLPGIGSNSH